MKRHLEILIRWGLSFILIYAGTNKFIDTISVNQNGQQLSNMILILISLIELTTGFILILVPTYILAYFVSASLFTAFTVWSLQWLSSNSIDSCGCGLPRFMDSSVPLVLVVRNTTFAILSFILLLLRRNIRTLSASIKET